MTTHPITRYAFDYLDGFIRTYFDDAYLPTLLADRAEMIEQVHAAALAENELSNAYDLSVTDSGVYVRALIKVCKYDHSVASYAPHGHQFAGPCHKGTCDGYWQQSYSSMISFMIDTVLTDAGIDGDDSRTYLADSTDLWSLALTLHNS